MAQTGGSSQCSNSVAIGGKGDVTKARSKMRCWVVEEVAAFSSMSSRLFDRFPLVDSD
jgi:hypothetical protein